MAPRPVSSGEQGAQAFSSGVSAILFMCFVVAGSAYIIAGKLGGVAQVYVTFVPVTIMLLYALLIFLARSLRLRDDQAGDNLYYMGFLFTLTSLGVSLYQFNANRAAEEIVQNFGIAIGSTITGIALRVIFNQMRHDPVEIERVMRLELADAARRVRRELDATVVEFGYIRRSAQQAAADSFSQMADKVDEIAGRLLANIADVAAKSAQPLDDASKRSADTIAGASHAMVESLATTTQQLAAETQRLSQSVVAISGTINDVTVKLAAMRTPDGVIEDLLDPVIQSLTGAVERFSAQSDQQATALREAITAARDGAPRQDGEVSSATSRAALKAALESSAAMTHVLDQFNADAWEQVELLRRLLEKTDGAFRSFTDAVTDSRADMAAQAQAFRDILFAIQTSTETLAMATERLADIADDFGVRRVAPKREAIR